MSIKCLCFARFICVFFLQFLCLWVLSECACAIVFVLACLLIVFVIIVFKCICICVWVFVYLCDCFCPLSPSPWLSFLYATSLCRVQITKLFTEKSCNCVSEHTNTHSQRGKVNTCTIAKLRPTAVPRTNHQAFTEQSEIRHLQVAKPLGKSFTPAQFMSSATCQQYAQPNAKKN